MCLLLVACVAIVSEEHFHSSVEYGVMCEGIGVSMWQIAITRDLLCFSYKMCKQVYFAFSCHAS